MGKGPTQQLGARLIYEALAVLKENGGELKSREVVKSVGERVELNDWAKERYEKSGYIRWQSLLHLFSIECVKAGFLVKKNGVWYLTDEGEEALKLTPDELMSQATKLYREWEKDNPKSDVEPVDDLPEEPDDAETDEITLEQVELLARQGLEDHIHKMNPYEFQDVVAALLHGMGYFTPFVAPRGKDGGVDIVAYRDPLGSVSPRIKVQVKHRRKQSANVEEVRQLKGILQKDGDVGLFISTGGYTSDARATARDSHVHVELIDLDRFIQMWVEFYPELDDEDKARLPLTPVWFLAPAD